MFEARILQGALLKKIIEAIRDLVTDANLDCTERGINMQVKNNIMYHFSPLYIDLNYQYNKGYGLFPCFLVCSQFEGGRI